jgi:putative transposase
MIKTYKVKLEPNNKQKTLLNSFAGTARWAYNWALTRQQENYKTGSKFLSDGDLRKELTQLKQTPEYKWLYKISNNVTKQAIKDACEAYKRFFVKKSAFPRFKSKKKCKPSFYHDNIKLKITETHAQLEKIGKVRLAECKRIPIGKYSNPRITFDGVSWYISVGAETEANQHILSGNLGIDLGIKDLAIASNGMVFKNINKSNKIKKMEKKKKRLQRKLSKKYKNNKKGVCYVKTQNIIKLEKSLRKISRKITNIRTDYIHKTTTTLVKTKPRRIVIEDLNVSGMLKNKRLSKAIQEQTFKEFRRQIEYKAKWNGIELVVADRFYPSSKMCSECGYINKNLKLSHRTYKCPCCGFEIDRDKNAAINLANYKSA